MTFSLPSISLKNLLECGVHFGHRSSRWNPKMSQYIYKKHHGVHIIDLPQTIALLNRALEAVYDTISKGGRVLFVGTKLQARKAIREAALRCGQYYVDHRWLGGTLTNWKTVSASLKKLRDLEEKVASPEFASYTKKEQLGFRRMLDKYEQSLGGIKNMGGLPDMLFVIDTNKEAIAVREAQQMEIPVMAIVDTNSTPDNIDYLVPGNDDALKAIEFYCDIVARTVISGIEEELSKGAKPVAEEKVEDPQITEELTETLSQEPA